MSSQRRRLGFLTHSGENETHNRLMFLGIEAACKSCGWDLILFDYKTKTGRNTDDELFEPILSSIAQFDLAGLLFLGWLRPFINNAQVLRARFPDLLLFSVGTAMENLNSSYVDNQQCLVDIAKHLIDVHHRQKIVLVGPHTSDQRLLTWENFLRQKDMWDPARLITEQDRINTDCDGLAQVLYERFLSQTPRKADAFYFMYGIEAVPFLRLIRQKGIEVPQDISIICNEDGDLVRNSSPAMTAVEYPLYELCYGSAMQCIAILEGQQRMNPLKISTGIAFRRSCGCPLTCTSLATDQSAHRAQNAVSYYGGKAIAQILGKPKGELAPHGSVLASLEPFWYSKNIEAFDRLFEALLENAESPYDLLFLEQELNSLCDTQSSDPMDQVLVLRHQVQLKDRVARLAVQTAGKKAEADRRLAQAGQELITSFDRNELIQVCAKHLKNLHLRGMRVTDSDGTQLVCIDDLSNLESDRAYQDPIQWLSNYPNPHSVVVQTLHHGQSLLGWVEFLIGPHTMGMYRDLSTYLASALVGARLVDDLNNWNRNLEFKVQERTKQLIDAYDQTIVGWAQALELRDQETKSHSDRVMRLSMLVCKRLGFSEEQLIMIKRGAILHDIGKIGVPDNILLKTGPLSQEERIVMQAHVDLGCKLVDGVEFLQPSRNIPAHHHENWNGQGYPNGLKGEEIPLEARAFAVIDVWDALTSDRPYRKAMSDVEALALLRSEAGTHFDPWVIQIFEQVLQENFW